MIGAVFSVAPSRNVLTETSLEVNHFCAEFFEQKTWLAQLKNIYS
jgi:hypothetical protein